MKRWKSLIIFVFLIALGIFGIKALFLPGFFTSHDAKFHLPKLASYITLLRESQFPPRWSGTLNNGLGYPVWVFTYPLPFMLASLFYFLGAGLGQSLELVFGLSFILSGIGAYLWLREYFSKLASFTGAVFFMYAPYRFSLIFVRGAVGEALALAFLPFILWAMARIYTKKEFGYTILSGLLLGFAITSHSLFLPMYLPVILLIGFLSPWLVKKVKKSVKIFNKRMALSIALGLATASYYLLPLILERKYIVFDQVYTNIAVEHLVTLGQLIHSSWGYGPSLPFPQADQMSFQVGLAQLGALVAVVLLLLVPKKLTPKFLIKRLGERERNLAVLGTALFLLGCILTLNTSITRWLWENLPGIQVIDFPWRFLGLTTLAGSILAAYLVEKVKWQELAAVGLIAITLVANRNHLRINQVLVVNEQAEFQSQVTTNTANEFMPIWRQDYSRKKFNQRVEVQQGNLELIESKSNLIHFKIQTDKAEMVQINSVYFPGWTAYKKTDAGWERIDLGSEWKIVNDGWNGYTKEDIVGTMQIAVPAGESEYKLEFKETPIRKAADLITLAALLGSFGYLLIKRIKN